jgi:hypothetical protein
LKTIVAYLILLVSLILSDLINESSPIDYLRGWASIIFSVISIIFLVRLLGNNSDNTKYYLIGIIISSILHKTLWSGDDTGIELEMIEENANYFKTRIMGFMNPTILVFSYYLSSIRQKQLPLLILFLYAILCIIMDARSNSLIFLIAAAILCFKTYRIRVRRGMVIFLSMIFLPIGYMLYCYYVDHVLYHDFGGKNSQNQLRQTKNPYNPLELLYYGRMDVFIAIEAVLDRPIIGYGSWGKDPDGKYAKIQAEWTDTEYLQKEDRFIRGHSVIFTAWLWAGIGGLISILYIFVLFFRMGIFIVRCGKPDILFIILPLFIEFVWHFLFSPFGYLRTTFPIIAALILVNNQTIKNQLFAITVKLKKIH